MSYPERESLGTVLFERDWFEGLLLICSEEVSENFFFFERRMLGAFLVVWLLIKNPPANVGADEFDPWSGIFGSPKPVLHSYWACAVEPGAAAAGAIAPQQENPHTEAWGAVPLSAARRKAHVQEWRPSAAKNK